MNRLRKKAGEQSAGAPGVTPDEAAQDKKRRAIMCLACGAEVTFEDARMDVSGRHQHTCVNPAGIIYRIGCFVSAPGCIGEGQWSDYYSWFAGYYWQIVCCGQCSIHLGWAFTGEGPDFHGLILDRIGAREPP